jgi:L-2-hydroxyglutarate oxidase LhgO
MAQALETEVAVAGGGVVGLAIARALALAGRSVVLLESGARCGAETSARNNQVVHAGFLYPPGSLKAALCRPGRDALMAYAAARGVPHRLAPKLMPVLADADLPLLDRLLAWGDAAGVPGLEIVQGAALARLEPALQARAALLSPLTGIVDAAALADALLADAEAAGATIALRTRVLSGTAGDPHRLTLSSAGEAAELTCDWLINAAGLGAAPLACGLASFPAEHVPVIHHAKGQFLAHAGAVPFRHLIVPAAPALLEAGGSLTFDTAGQARFGADLSFVRGRDYALTPEVPDAAVQAIRAWWPGLDPARLSPDYAGIRPRVTGPGQPPGDWRIDGPGAHGVPGMIHLFGIDTPGLTACLALADHVAGLMQDLNRTTRSSAA